MTEFEGQSFHPDLANALRVWPFDFHTNGFFAVKLIKQKHLASDLRKEAIWSLGEIGGEQVVELLEALLDNAERRAAAAREHVGREYGIDRAVEEHLALFSSLSQQKRSPVRS